MVDCPMCQGRGRVRWDMAFGAEWMECPHCDGTGQISTDAGLDEVPVVVEIDVVRIECADCIGRGWKECYRSGRLSDWVAGTCQSCKGERQILRPAA